MNKINIQKCNIYDGWIYREKDREKRKRFEEKIVLKRFKQFYPNSILCLIIVGCGIRE